MSETTLAGEGRRSGSGERRRHDAHAAAARVDGFAERRRLDGNAAVAHAEGLVAPRLEEVARPNPATARPHPQPEESDLRRDRVAHFRLFHGHYHRLAALAIAEGSVAALAMYAAIAARFGETHLGELSDIAGPVWPRATIAAALVVISMASMGLYSLRQRAGMAGVIARVLLAILGATAALALAFYAVPELYLGRGVLGFAGAFTLSGLLLVRYGFMRFVDEDVFKRRVLVWGSGERAANIAARLRRRADQRGFRVVGYVKSPGEVPQVPAEQVIENEPHLMRNILRNRVAEVVVAMDDRRNGFPHALLRECRLSGIAVRDIVTFLEHESGRVNVDLAQPSWLIFSDGFRSGFVRIALKRALDITMALALIVLAFPLALLAAIAIFIEDRGPVLYRQTRVGQDGRHFSMLKFRSMSVNAEAKGAVWAVKNDPRVTRVGAFIRKVRIDELPQAINVLLGHMSFVGPRPERPAFVESLSRTIPFYAERHFVKPGLTGWAQVSFPYGSSEADAREKLGYDLYYVKNHSLVFDLVVLLRTVEIVLFRVGSR
jgi:sugar transferase (PEP-CTERM system associated)